ncbi:MAG TPA: DAK2 domain-containing protein [Acholeplasmataceae bacterium]|jgi:DAK2 domain fusion protein YloV|nr:DAK2 domain-containing protein [Acholeplasmataceae bacterium]HQC30506.1 DAK2 domain-containing protein [Acholeplasmataceae bacterium]
MANYSVSGKLFKKMVTNGAVNLKNNYKEIDHLNVFPVPDGDTGTNMQMTMMAGIREIESKEDKSIIDISKILSRGLLMGARGNSGVILSQFFRGVYSEISKINNGTATVKEFIQALVGGYQMAYRAVMDPVEGTILTVVREAAEKVLEEENNLHTIEEVMDLYVRQAHETLERTPEILPVLKEAGVVDSGGAGFIKIIEGMQMALNGQMLTEVDAQPVATQMPEFVDNHAFESLQDIKFAYCTEFIVKLFDQDKFNDTQIKKPLMQMGDSLVVVVMDDLLKVHVHTNQPGVALTLAQKYGELQTIKIENMKLQHHSIVENHQASAQPTPEPVKSKEKTKYAIIAVASGDGIKNSFKELGVDYIIDGGQTMNPSAEEFVKAVNELNADNIIIIPNNSNIVLTAEQTIDLLPERTIRVLKTKTISQGYASLMVFDPTRSLDENLEEMSDVVADVNSGEITYAVRDTTVNGVEIKKDDYIGIYNNKIAVSTNSRLKSTKNLLKQMITEESEIVTIFFGSDVSEKEVEKIAEYIENIAPDVDVDIIDGRQDIYSYIIAVE